MNRRDDFAQLVALLATKSTLNGWEAAVFLAEAQRIPTEAFNGDFDLGEAAVAWWRWRVLKATKEPEWHARMREARELRADLVTIRVVDPRHDWWGHAIALRGDAPDVLRALLDEMDTMEVRATQRVARAVRAWCASLPGWNDAGGPPLEFDGLKETA